MPNEQYVKREIRDLGALRERTPFGAGPGDGSSPKCIRNS